MNGNDVSLRIRDNVVGRAASCKDDGLEARAGHNYYVAKYRACCRQYWLKLLVTSYCYITFR